MIEKKVSLEELLGPLAKYVPGFGKLAMERMAYQRMQKGQGFGITTSDTRFIVKLADLQDYFAKNPAPTPAMTEKQELEYLREKVKKAEMDDALAEKKEKEYEDARVPPPKRKPGRPPKVQSLQGNPNSLTPSAFTPTKDERIPQKDIRKELAEELKSQQADDQSEGK